MSEYSFTTDWTFDAPVERVWDVVSRPLEWPEWWRGVERVIQLEAGGEDGLGGVHRSTWKSALPYRLTFDSRVVQVQRLRCYEIRATGDLQGQGVWTFTQTPSGTLVRYQWNVAATEWWMRLLAPVARPFFRWNHDVIMRWGYDGLRRRLRARDPA